MFSVSILVLANSYYLHIYVVTPMHSLLLGSHLACRVFCKKLVIIQLYMLFTCLCSDANVSPLIRFAFSVAYFLQEPSNYPMVQVIYVHVYVTSMHLFLRGLHLKWRVFLLGIFHAVIILRLYFAIEISH